MQTAMCNRGARKGACVNGRGVVCDWGGGGTCPACEWEGHVHEQEGVCMQAPSPTPTLTA
jgi:hypothetical protein